MAERSIGGVPEEDIAEHYRQKGIPADAGADRVVRFLRLLGSLVLRRLDAGERHDGAVFLLADKVADVMKGRSGDPKPALINGNDEITGRVWTLNTRLANAHILNITWATGSGFEDIIEAGLGDLPAVILDLRNPAAGPQALFFPEGVSDADVMLQVHLSENPIDADRMKNTLDQFFEDNLRTPMTIIAGHGDRIWAEAGRGVPQPRPEETIESLLLRWLKSSYPTHDARAQKATDDGILDIVVHYDDRTAAGFPAKRCDWVLELKALADRTSTGNPSNADVPDAMQKGLRQTIAYANYEKSLARALCVYDLRAVANDDETCFDEIRQDADDYEVHLWRWHLLRSADQGRQMRISLRADTARRAADPS